MEFTTILPVEIGLAVGTEVPERLEGVIRITPRFPAIEASLSALE